MYEYICKITYANVKYLPVVVVLPIVVTFFGFFSVLLISFVSKTCDISICSTDLYTIKIIIIMINKIISS